MRVVISVAARVAALLVAPVALHGQAAANDTTIHVSFGAFVDGYYAWDFGRPPTFDRSFAGGALFTTQPARDNEFNVNLAFVEAKLEGARVRGRLAFQAGTSVQSNYSAESTIGQVSGSTLARNIQEAVVGVKVSDNIWVDGGIFFSHLGMEGWISRDNPTYTRSLVSEYSPYYQSGAKITWAVHPKLTAQLDVVNGWQNIAENNSGKGAGVRLDFAPTASTTISYYDLFSDEAGNRLRTFNGIGAKYTAGQITLLAEADAGSQSHSAADGGTATWYGLTGVARLPLSTRLMAVARIERFDDRDQVLIATGVDEDGLRNGPLRANGASIGIDAIPAARVLWRTELRGFTNRTGVFPDGPAAARKTNVLVVTSLALTM